MISILTDEMRRGRYDAVLHCFSSGQDLARVGVELGLYVSFSGVLTFKKSDEIRAIAANVPQDRILVETDAPYLAPEPHRGRTNEPAYVAHTAAVLAETSDWALLRSQRLRRTTFIGCSGRLPSWTALPRWARRNEFQGHDPWLRFVGRRPARGNRLGRLRPDRTQEPATALLHLGRGDGPGGTTSVLVDTSPDLREQLLDGRSTASGRRPVHARSRRPYPRDRRPTASRDGHASPDSVYDDRMTTVLLQARFGYCFAAPAGSGLPADPRATLAAGWRERRAIR